MKSFLKTLAGICLASSTLSLLAAMPPSNPAIIQCCTTNPVESSHPLALFKGEGQGEGCPDVTKTTVLNSTSPHFPGLFPQNTIFLQLSMLAANIEWTAPKTNEMASLDSFLEPYLKQFKLPALAAAVVSSDQIIAAGAVGVRKIGEDAQVTLNDKFHIGSCTKSITALLATMLAADGKISLDL
ncbi:MAG: serine hydrolase domain-containing protein, partial [Verrucomicrobiota bacterium]